MLFKLISDFLLSSRRYNNRILGKANQSNSSAGITVQTVSNSWASTIVRVVNLVVSNRTPMIQTKVKIPISNVKAWS